MKIIFISDIHGSAVAMKFMENIFNEETPDCIVILGDQLYHGPRNPLPIGYDPEKTAELLNKYKGKIIAVKGNCDSEVDQMVLDYPIMAEYSHILLKNKKIFLTHGHKYTYEKIPKLNNGDIYAFGHTHLPVLEKKNDLIFLNPGSISLPKNDNLPSYAVLTDDEIAIFTINNYQNVSKVQSITIE